MKLVNNCIHISRPVKARGLCGSCYNKSISYGNPENRETYLIKRNKYAKQRREKSDPALWARAQRNRILRHRYGISQEDYVRLLQTQQNKCSICGNLWKAKQPLYVDHNHITKQVRGLLCAKCNTLVGVMETSDTGDARKYLAEWNSLARLELLIRELNVIKK